MKWFFPSYAGDFRLEPLDPAATYRDAPEDLAQGCLLRILDPTAAERVLLERFLADAKKRKWTTTTTIELEKEGDQLVQTIVLRAPIAKAGPPLLKLIRPKESTLTAFSYADGRVVTTSGTSSDAIADIEKALDAPEDKAPKAAASVSRPTPCCPECLPGAIEPATEVLLSFLTPQQHADWSEHRAIVVTGHLSGHQYLLMHRNSQIAAINGKVCFDLTDNARMHFHDSSVPPEEEILASKLILEHAEPWLRNEATCLMPRDSGIVRPGVKAANGFPLEPGRMWALGSERRCVFKNPFGGLGDGTESAAFAQDFGSGFAQAAQLLASKS